MLPWIAVIRTICWCAPRSEKRIKGKVLKIIAEKSKTKWILPVIRFFLQCTKLCKIIGEVENPDALYQWVILWTKLQPGNSPGWIQPGCNMHCGKTLGFKWRKTHLSSVINIKVLFVSFQNFLPIQYSTHILLFHHRK